MAYIVLKCRQETVHSLTAEHSFSCFLFRKYYIYLQL